MCCQLTLNRMWTTYADMLKTWTGFKMWTCCLCTL